MVQEQINQITATVNQTDIFDYKIPAKRKKPGDPPDKKFGWSQKFEWRRLAAKAGYTWQQFIELDLDIAAFEIAYATVSERVEDISNAT